MEDKYEDLIALIGAMIRLYEAKDKRMLDLGHRKYLGLKWILRNENLLKGYYVDNKEKILPDLLQSFLTDYHGEIIKGIEESIDEGLKSTMNALADGFEAEGFE